METKQAFAVGKCLFCFHAVMPYALFVFVFPASWHKVYVNV